MFLDAIEKCVFCLQIRSYMRNALQRLPGTLFSHRKLASIIMTNDCFFSAGDEYLVVNDGTCRGDGVFTLSLYTSLLLLLLYDQGY